MKPDWLHVHCKVRERVTREVMVLLSVPLLMFEIFLFLSLDRMLESS